jgi:hypothetical protein
MDAGILGAGALYIGKFLIRFIFKPQMGALLPGGLALFGWRIAVHVVGPTRRNCSSTEPIRLSPLPQLLGAGGILGEMGWSRCRGILHPPHCGGWS